MHMLVMLMFRNGNMGVNIMWLFINTIVGLLFVINLIRFFYYHKEFIKVAKRLRPNMEKSVFLSPKNYWSFIFAGNDNEVDERIEYYRRQIRQSSTYALLFFVAFIAFFIVGSIWR